MGIAIHLQGRLRNAAEISRLVDEVSDIAETLRWPYKVIDDGDLHGIFVTPHHQCETLTLVLDRDGILRNPVLPRDHEWIAIKTQYAPVDVHICLVELIRHLKKRYFAELEVRDEGEYWETGDRGRLVTLRSRLDTAMDQLRQTLEDSPAPPSDAKAEDIVARLEEVIAHLGEQSEEEGVEADEAERDLRALLREPERPDNEVLHTWHVDDWMEYFERHDRGRSPILRAMAGREVTPEALAEAAKVAEEEEARFGRAARKFLLRGMQEQVRRINEDEKPEGGGAGYEIEESSDDQELAWRESLPEYVKGGVAGIPNLDEAFAEIAAECPALEEAHTFLAEIHQLVRNQEAPPPIVDYLSACASSAVVGVYMGRYWSKENGFPLAQTARYALAAERFATVARLLGKFPVAGFEGMADRAEKISDGFRVAAKEGPGGNQMG